MRFLNTVTKHLCRAFALANAIALFGLISEPVRSQPASRRASTTAEMRAQMANIAAVTQGPVGAAVVVVEGGRIIALHGKQRFPMQSTYKLPIGMAVLNQVDLGRLNLNKRVRINSADLPRPPHYSPIRDEYPNGTSMTVSKLLDEMMRVSDGTACDILLKLVGGPKYVMAYLRDIGIQNIVVATSERTMWQNEQVEQYRNWTTPDAMIGLLCILQQGKGLSVSSRKRLLELMIGSETGPHRIKGLLPAGTIVAHKTGSSGTVNGLTRATNDVGIVTLPNGKHLAVVVFVSDTRVNTATQEAVIAKITRVAWDCRAELESGR